MVSDYCKIKEDTTALELQIECRLERIRTLKEALTGVRSLSGEISLLRELTAEIVALRELRQTAFLTEQSRRQIESNTAPIQAKWKLAMPATRSNRTNLT